MMYAFGLGIGNGDCFGVKVDDSGCFQRRINDVDALIELKTADALGDDLGQHDNGAADGK